MVVMGAEIPVFVGVGVAAEADAVPVGGDGGEEGVVIDIGGAGTTAGEGFQRHVEAAHHQRIGWHMPQDVADEVQLPIAEIAAIAALAAAAGGVGAEIFDIVEHEEHCAGMEERVIARAVNPFEGFA